MKVYIKENTNYYAPIKYVLKLIEKNRKLTFSFVDSVENADISWDEHHPSSEPIDISFYNNLIENRELLKHENYFSEEPTLDPKQDLIAPIFYLVNCLQEISTSPEDFDNFNRFKYTHSYQYKFKNIERNLVEELMNVFCTKHNLTGKKTKSRFFISHDIDTIYGSLLQDGFWAVKNLKIGTLLHLITLELMRKPHWRNMDKIIKINDEYDVKTTFFWLVNKGKGTQDVMNADYKINKEKDLLELVANSNNTNGLHKSCSTMSINEELTKGNISNPYNRYHFLNFKAHSDWKKISDSDLEFDGSLGFAEHYGFRNSYGKAFQPFNVDEKKPYDFVEAPLHFMDGTFHKYMKMPSQNIAKTIINFYEKNNENCDFSLLWHNTYFTNYKYNSFLEEYKKVLSYLYENKIDCVTPQHLIDENKLTW
ncbi:hypothetical protein SAMN05216474_3119 [Lishizhenia tianjinensis]|uniref:DUF7033 domain-containing protein n=1 Tax=Lishizhenia tianjinensis TaxID=477690 RepID=A0A1I7BVP4_9FLAO|nr:hypothetical protein [Lishizhenia tianjinensis]SFT91237.1 hypothetical protein SAMN05216474_3119 [Lishizhenia tianjinensis]